MSNLTDALIAAKLIGGSGGSGGGSGLPNTVMQGCYYAELLGASATTADVEFYRLDGTPLYVYSTLSWETQGESGYFCHVGEIVPNPEEATISESELAYLTFKFYALFQKGDMSMGSSLQSAFYAAMERLFELPDYDGPTPVFFF